MVVLRDTEKCSCSFLVPIAEEKTTKGPTFYFILTVFYNYLSFILFICFVGYIYAYKTAKIFSGAFSSDPTPP